MDILKPEILALVVGVVGITEVTKKIGLRLPTYLVSLILSITAGIVGADTLTVQSAAMTAFVVYGASTLAYESVVRRVSGKKQDDTQPIQSKRGGGL